MRLRTKLMGGVLTAAALVGSVGAGTARADTSGRDDDTRRSAVAGPLPYALLAAQWWKWALETPTADNPLLDTTGASCAVRQPRFGPWFLAGQATNEPITRTCAVPRDRPLFFPAINLFFGAFLNDPAEQRTLAFARSAVACESGATASVTVDGRTLPGRQLVHEQSVPFRVQLPASNVFGLTPDVATDLVLSPSVDQGDYVLLPPLRRGAHTIHIVSALTASCGGATNDITYHLTVG